MILPLKEKSMPRYLSVVAVLLLVFTADVHADPARFFEIQVTDKQTGRGVPLVELVTVEQRSVRDRQRRTGCL